MKEIWIKILEEEAQHEIMDFIMGMDDDDLGSVPVILFCSTTNTQKRLPFAYSCSENAMYSLRRKFGDDCVKLVERRTTDNSLERIADALEGIKKSLDKLAACTDDAKGYGRRLYIAGDITVGD